MESLLPLVGFVALLLFIGFPIWVIARISTLARELDETRRRLDGSTALNAAARTESASQPSVSTPEPAPAPSEGPEPPSIIFAPKPAGVPPPIIPAATVMPAPKAEMQQPPVIPPPVQEAFAQKPRAVPPPVPVIPQFAAPPPMPVRGPVSRERESQPFNWEVLFGTKFLAWFGGAAAFLALAFFLKYSFEHGWISHTVQAIMGYVFAAGLVAGGLFAMRKKYDITGHTLCACGIVSLYSVTFACHAYYHFPAFGVMVTFVLMSLITIAAFALAVRLNGKWVAILGILGGFLTPVLLSTGVDNPVGLFGYIALLDVGLYAVALRQRWHFLVPLGALGTVFMQLGWAFNFLGNHNTFVPMVVCLVFDGLFLSGLALARRMKIEGQPHVSSVFALVLSSFGFALYLTVESAAGCQPWRLFGFVFLVDACMLAVTALEKRPGVSMSAPMFSGIAVFVLLAAWSLHWVDEHSGLLMWALGLYLIFAVLHTAFPLLLARMKGARGGASGAGAQLFAPLALLLVLAPVAKHSGTPFSVWPVILLLDLVAIAGAAFARSVAGLAAALVLTLVTAAAFIFKIPAQAAHMPVSLLLIIAGFAAVFFAASLWLGRKLGADGRGDAASHFSTTMPALSSLLPFVLIVMMVARLVIVNPTPVFGLGLLLVVLALALAKILKNEWLPGCALAGVLAVCYAWYSSVSPMLGAVGAPGWLPAVALAWFAGFCAVFTAYPFVLRSDFSDTRGAWIVSAAAGPLFFPLVYVLVKAAWPNDFMGVIPAVFAVPAALCLAVIRRVDPPGHPLRLGRLALFGGVALLFITLIFPIQFRREWITIGWALEGAALLWLYMRVPHRGLPWAGAGLLGVAFVRLALNPAVLSYHVAGSTPVLNWFLYAYGIVAACMFAGAWFLKNARAHDLLDPLRKTLPALGVILAFLLLNIEIADFFTPTGSRAITLEFSGNFARDMTYTISWALFALALLVAGIWKKNSAARYTALALLGVVALKLLLHDLASLDTLYRVAALFAVAVIMILSSFLYQKYIAPRGVPKKDGL